MTTLTTFAIGVLLLLALAGWMLRSAWRAPLPATGAARPAHLGILAEQLATLDRDLAAGRLDPAQHRAARSELERRVLDESVDVPDSSVDNDPRRLRWVVALAVPLASIGLYAAIGNRAALEAGTTAGLPVAAGAAAAEPEVSPEAVDALLASLAKRLETPSADPAADVRGWTMLARSYATLQRYAEADRAFARAIALAPADANLLADRADVLAMRQGERVAGEPERLVEQALRLDPRNVKALALAGTVAYERRDFATARSRWQAARALLPPGSDFATGLDRSLAEVGGIAPGSAPNPATGTSPGDGPALAGSPQSSALAKADSSSAPVAGVTTPASVRGRVTLAPGLAGKAAPTDTVFIVARAVDGPRMPLAVIRRTVADLPFDFTLDDALAMQPAMKLSAFDKVIVSARVSASGNAMPQPGDLRGESGAVSNRASGLSLSIDAVQP